MNVKKQVFCYIKYFQLKTAYIVVTICYDENKKEQQRGGNDKLVKVRNCEVDYHVDYLNQAIHIKDKTGHYSQNSVANHVCLEWQKELIEQEGFLKDVLAFDWYLYFSDFLICEYKSSGFTFVRDRSKLHEPFVKEVL